MSDVHRACFAPRRRVRHAHALLRHADAAGQLRAWHTIVERGTFNSPHDLKKTFPSADMVGDERVVFNIGGNKYRLIVDVRYEWKRVYIVAVLTHPEYDRVDVRKL